MGDRAPYDVTIARDATFAVILDVRCALNDRASLGHSALALGPEEYLLIESDPISLVNSAWGDSVIATDVSAMFVRYRLTGVDAIAVLAQGVPVDIELMPIGAGTRSLLARAGVILIRRDDGFELLIERSYARYAENWLTAASGVPVHSTAI